MIAHDELLKHLRSYASARGKKVVSITGNRMIMLLDLIDLQADLIDRQQREIIALRADIEALKTRPALKDIARE